MERENQTNVPNVEVQTYTEPLKIGGMPELERAADGKVLH
jgi:hypothetical protein